MSAVGYVHSVPVLRPPEPCRTAAALPHPRLRGYVVGYGAFRSGSGTAVAHRVLPMNLTTVILDLDGAGGLVTGPCGSATVDQRARWGYGVSMGVTPAGVTALLGVAMSELVGVHAAPADLLGSRASELCERLAEAPNGLERFAVLDSWLTARAADADAVAGSEPDQRVLAAWRRLESSAGRVPITTVAEEMAISRRGLEMGFRRWIGLPPARVQRIARFQRAVGLLTGGAGLSHTAMGCGYADQSHFTREVRAMAGLTPRQLCAFLQDRRPAGPLPSPA